MKVLLVNGSSHAHGTTMRALEEMIQIFDAEGVETEVIQLGAQAYKDCLQCGACRKTGKCAFGDDDGVNAFIDKAREADGFVFASPTYYAHPSGRIFSFLDRVFFAAGKDVFRYKVGAAVAVARRGGNSANFDALNKYFTISEIPVASSTYWNMAHGHNAEEAAQDAEGMQTMRNLARNMVWMMRCFAAGKAAGVPYPASEYNAVTNFIR